MKQRWLVYGLVVALVAVTADLVTARRRAPASAQTGRAGPTSQTHADGGVRNELKGTTLFRNIEERENPIVVWITTQRRLGVPEMTKCSDGDDCLHRYFGGPMARRDHLQRGLGSGFLIADNGEILTNNRVIAGAEQIRVSLFSADHTTYAATVVGAIH